MWPKQILHTSLVFCCFEQAVPGEKCLHSMYVGEWRFQGGMELSKRKQLKSIIWALCTPSAYYHNLSYFLSNSDMGTVVFCAKRNYSYYFDFSTWVLP